MSYKTLATTLVGLKRVRREMEPEAKPWHDEALEKPWEALRIKPVLTKEVRAMYDEEDEDFKEHEDMRVTVFDENEPRYGGRAVRDVVPFILKNVFFFSHATEVQATAVPLFRNPGTSVIVEAATGSGKTLAFLVPILERILYSCHSAILSTGMPILHRGIVAVVLSPSRMLASQTFVVAKKLCSRLPFGIDAILCDRLVEPPAKVLDHLSRQRRGAGTVLITTPGDLAALLGVVFPHLASESEEENASASGGDEEVEEGDGEVSPSDSEESCVVAAVAEEDDEAYNAAIALMEGSVSRGPHVGGGANADKCFTHMRGDIKILRRMGAIPRNSTEDVDGEPTKPIGKAAHHETIASAASSLTPLPFMLVIDEADVVMKAMIMREQVESFVSLMKRVSGVDGSVTLGEDDGDAFANCPGIDIGLYGATVDSSVHVKDFAAKFCPPLTTPETIDAPPASAPITKKGSKKEKETSKKTVGGKRKAGCEVLTTGETDGLPKPSLRSVVLHTNADFISLLENKYVLSPTSDFLHTLVHLINLHPNKKHFVFFNSVPVLLFVKSVLEKLVGGRNMTGAAKAAAKRAESTSQLTAKRRRRHKKGQPLGFVMDAIEGGGAVGGAAPKVLYVPTIMTMHEELSETAKFNEYNAFLSHDCGTGKASVSAAGGGFVKAHMLAHKRDKILAREGGASASSGGASTRDKLVEEGQHFVGGLKRDQSHKSGTGAVLLCTDEAAFGLDVRDVDYVYHAELPRTRQAYVHRIGRVGRMGMRGQSVMILTGSGDGTLRVEDLSDEAGAKRLAARLGGVAEGKLASTDPEAHTYNNAGSFRTIVSRRRGKFHNGLSMNQALEAIVKPAEISNLGKHNLHGSDDDSDDSSLDETQLEEESNALKAVLSPKQLEFFKALQGTRHMTRYYLPQVAPLTSTIRSVIWHKPGNTNIATTTVPTLPPLISNLGQPAAMALANFSQKKPQHVDPGASDATIDDSPDAFSWYTPKAALEALLLSSMAKRN